MERRGVYRKGSAGHVRNIGAYRLARQNFKKWRYPITGFLVLALVFGIAPITGNEFQASLLTSGKTAELVEKNPEQARKILLSLTDELMKDCERFKMPECALRGKALITQLADQKNELSTLLIAVEQFENDFENEIARRACRYDLGKLAAQGKTLARDLQKFFDRYGDFLEGEYKKLARFPDAMTELSRLVDLCRLR